MYAEDFGELVFIWINSIAIFILFVSIQAGWTVMAFLFGSIVVTFSFILLAIMIVKFIVWISYRW